MTEANVITADGLEALTAELAELEGEGRREIAERIKTAREWGDLKENSEYHDAKNDQSHLETKIAKLRERISRVGGRRAGAGAGDGAVAFGSVVVVADEAGSEQTWTIVSSHEAVAQGGPPVDRVAGGQGADRPAGGRHDVDPAAARVADLDRRQRRAERTSWEPARVLREAGRRPGGAGSSATVAP